MKSEKEKIISRPSSVPPQAGLRRMDKGAKDAKKNFLTPLRLKATARQVGFLRTRIFADFHGSRHMNTVRSGGNSE